MVGGFAARDRPGLGCCAQRKYRGHQPEHEQRFQDILIRLATAAGTVLFCSDTATIGQRREEDRANEVIYDHWLDITLCIPSVLPARDSKIYLLEYQERVVAGQTTTPGSMAQGLHYAG